MKIDNPNPKITQEKFEILEYPICSKRYITVENKPENRNFHDVIFLRRSSKINAAANEKLLQELLFYISKIDSVATDEWGNKLSRRTTPSAGAIHPVDILYSFPTESNLRNLGFFDPRDSSLNDLLLDANLLKEFFSEIGETVDISNAFIIWFSIQPDKTEAKYENPESLYWRDAGALLYCVQIFAKYLGLSSLPVGTLASKSFEKLFGLKLISGGGILIGKSI